MELSVENLDHGIKKIRLKGRLDILGVQAIDMRFTAATATQNTFIVVDLSELSFMASLGMRTLISNAKALSKRGGRMVLANPQPNVLEVLQVSGVANLIPVHTDLADAIADLRSQPPG